MSKETWLPRFTDDDITHMKRFSSVADGVNKRLEDFEAKCTRVVRKEIGPFWHVQDVVDSYDFESLLLPPRPIKRGVTKAEIESLLDQAHTSADRADAATKLLIRIKDEGIINE